MMEGGGGSRDIAVSVCYKDRIVYTSVGIGILDHVAFGKFSTK